MTIRRRSANRGLVVMRRVRATTKEGHISVTLIWPQSDWRRYNKLELAGEYSRTNTSYKMDEKNFRRKLVDRHVWPSAAPFRCSRNGRSASETASGLKRSSSSTGPPDVLTYAPITIGLPANWRRFRPSRFTLITIIIITFVRVCYSLKGCSTKSSVTSPSPVNPEIKYRNTFVPRFSVSITLHDDVVVFTFVRLRNEMWRERPRPVALRN